MLALAHRAHSGLLHETVVWAYILSNERDHCRDKCSHWPIGHTAGCCTILSCGPTYFPMSGITAKLNARIGPIGHTVGCCTRTPYGPTYFSMSGITAEINARIGQSGTQRAVERDCRVGLHIFQ